jgi:hypothetical protein
MEIPKAEVLRELSLNQIVDNIPSLAFKTHSYNLNHQLMWMIRQILLEYNLIITYMKSKPCLGYSCATNQNHLKLWQILRWAPRPIHKGLQLFIVPTPAAAPLHGLWPSPRLGSESLIGRLEVFSSPGKGTRNQIQLRQNPLGSLCCKQLYNTPFKTRIY